MPQEHSPIEAPAPPETVPPARGAGNPHLRLLLVAAFLHGLAFVLLLPPWMGEDEPWHVEYAHHIADGHLPVDGQAMTLEGLEEVSHSQMQMRRELGGLETAELAATQHDILESMRANHFWARVDWASWGGGAETFDQVAPDLTAAHQPPLYYLLSGQVLRLLGSGDVEREMWIERGLSLLAYLAVVLAAYALASRVSDDPWIAITAAALVAWWPMHARQAAVANNDVLVKVFTAWALVMGAELARSGITTKRIAWIVVLCVAGFATKTTAAGVVAPIGLALLWRGGQRAGTMGWKVRAGLILGLASLAGLTLVMWFNSSNPAVPHSVANLKGRIQTALAPEFWSEFSRTTVGAFNWYSRDLASGVHVAVRFGLLLGLAGAALALVVKRSGIDRRVLFFCALAAITQIALVGLRGVAAGRYMMPMITAFGVLLAVGWMAVLPEGWRRRVGALLITALLIFDGIFITTGLIWNQYGVWGS